VEDIDLFLVDLEDIPDLILLFEAGLPAIIETPAPAHGARRKPPLAAVPHIAVRVRSEEEQEKLRLLKLLAQANDAKSLKKWQEAENEVARKHHQDLVLKRVRGTYERNRAAGVPDIRKANKEIAKREEKEERDRQERIRKQRLANLEKARKSKKH